MAGHMAEKEQQEPGMMTLFDPGNMVPKFFIGLLGAKGATLEEAKANRLHEIEWRILKIEKALNDLFSMKLDDSE